MIKICVAGSKGKMGQRIIALANDDPEIEVTGQFDIGDDARAAIEVSDCLIEFTLPEATLEHLNICEELKKPIVIGTTGMTNQDHAKIKAVATAIPVVFSPNMSIGVNVLFDMVRTASKILGNEYEVSILEAHHVHKKDAPSGTAKELAAIIKHEKKIPNVPIESIREDEIVGEHTVTFESPFDLIEVTHSAKTRDIFAKGALHAAKFVVSRASGMFTMREVLGA